MDEDEKALDMVLEGMGNAARGYKAKRWAPKPPVAVAAPEVNEPAEPVINPADIEALLAPTE